MWYRAAPPPALLRPLAALFAAGVRVRRAAYARGWLRVHRLARPVVVVGNLTVGGSGKTPLVIWLAAQLRAAGLAPGIVLRGYGGKAARGGNPLLVQPDSDPASVGDEALLLRRRTGEAVATGRDRAAAARLLLAQGVDVVIADDGLQHLALARNFEIAVVDGERGFGNGYLLPAGPLRETPARLTEVDAVVINGQGRYWRQLTAGEGAAAEGAVPRLVLPAAGLRPFTMRVSGDRLIALDGGRATMPLSQLAGRRVHAVAAIGNPERFFSQLRAAQLEVIDHAFRDHHRFRSDELAFGDGLPLLMTEKDAVKCGQLGLSDAWYLPVSAGFDAAEATALTARVRRAIEAAARHQAGE
ncbi:MAG TPA: tetraacyldisaccharide 4'-kinase [Steroidobacteraceae bacterium]|jgi:tetraacyldisaccharide 4'-kinase